MSGGVSITVDSVGFKAMLESLAQVSGKTFEEVLKQQTQAVLKNCLKWTPRADRQKIIKKLSENGTRATFEDGTEVVTWTKEASQPVMFLDESTFTGSGKRPYLKNGKSWHQMDGRRRWSDERWAKFKQLEARRMQRFNEIQKAKLASIGVTKQSWLKVGSDFGIVLDAPGYVVKAKPQNGKTYKDGKGTKVSNGSSFYFEILNSNPILTNDRVKGEAILSRAIQARIRAFDNDMRRGVFNDLKMRASRYPGIFVTP